MLIRAHGLMIHQDCTSLKFSMNSTVFKKHEFLVNFLSYKQGPFYELQTPLNELQNDMFLKRKIVFTIKQK